MQSYTLKQNLSVFDASFEGKFIDSNLTCFQTTDVCNYSFSCQQFAGNDSCLNVMEFGDKLKLEEFSSDTSSGFNDCDSSHSSDYCKEDNYFTSDSSSCSKNIENFIQNSSPEETGENTFDYFLFMEEYNTWDERYFLNDAVDNENDSLEKAINDAYDDAGAFNLLQTLSQIVQDDANDVIDQNNSTNDKSLNNLNSELPTQNPEDLDLESYLDKIMNSSFRPGIENCNELAILSQLVKDDVIVADVDDIISVIDKVNLSHVKNLDNVSSELCFGSSKEKPTHNSENLNIVVGGNKTFSNKSCGFSSSGSDLSQLPEVINDPMKEYQQELNKDEVIISFSPAIPSLDDLIKDVKAGVYCDSKHNESLNSQNFNYFSDCASLYSVSSFLEEETNQTTLPNSPLALPTCQPTQNLNHSSDCGASFYSENSFPEENANKNKTIHGQQWNF